MIKFKLANLEKNHGEDMNVMNIDPDFFFFNSKQNSNMKKCRKKQNVRHSSVSRKKLSKNSIKIGIRERLRVTIRKQNAIQKNTPNVNKSSLI